MARRAAGASTTTSERERVECAREIVDWYLARKGTESPTSWVGGRGEASLSSVHPHFSLVYPVLSSMRRTLQAARRLRI